MHQDLVGVVAQTEALQELVGQPHHFVHPSVVFLLVGKDIIEPIYTILDRVAHEAITIRRSEHRSSKNIITIG